MPNLQSNAASTENNNSELNENGEIYWWETLVFILSNLVVDENVEDLTTDSNSNEDLNEHVYDENSDGDSVDNEISDEIDDDPYVSNLKLETWNLKLEMKFVTWIQVSSWTLL